MEHKLDDARARLTNNPKVFADHVKALEIVTLVYSTSSSELVTYPIPQTSSGR